MRYLPRDKSDAITIDGALRQPVLFRSDQSKNCKSPFTFHLFLFAFVFLLTLHAYINLVSGCIISPSPPPIAQLITFLTLICISLSTVNNGGVNCYCQDSLVIEIHVRTFFQCANLWCFERFLIPWPGNSRPSKTNVCLGS